MDAPEVLTKEVGAGPLKLPLWMWGVAAVAGVFIARKIGPGLFGGGASSSDEEDAPGDEMTSGLPTIGAGGAVNIVPGGGFDSGASSAIADNNEWRIKAVDWLSKNNYNPHGAAVAIDKYLNGELLTPNETLMIEAALRALGPTPEPVTMPIEQQPTQTIKLGPQLTPAEFARISFAHQVYFKSATTSNGAKVHVLIDINKGLLTPGEWSQLSESHRAQWRPALTTNKAKVYVANDRTAPLA